MVNPIKKRKPINDFEVGEVIELPEHMGKWKVVGLDEDFVRLAKVGDNGWTWHIFNKKTHPQYKMLKKAKEDMIKNGIQP